LLPLETLISEYGPGQYELTLQYRSDLRRAADDLVMLKRLVSAVARRHGMTACFTALSFGLVHASPLSTLPPRIANGCSSLARQSARDCAAPELSGRWPAPSTIALLQGRCHSRDDSQYHIARKGIIVAVDDKPPVSRGFVGRRRATAERERVPPGQYVTLDFPILSAGPTPHTPLQEWSFALQHGPNRLAEWNWQQFEALPKTSITVDIHCVTKWSKFDTGWEGVTIDALIKAAGLEQSPTAYVMAYSDGGYTTNLPVADLLNGRGMIASKFNGEPLAPGHGGPARLLVPHLYFWKSAKWVRGLSFVAEDKPGFWESLGYHMYGDPWKEQRYSGD
jgi:DMSO/TMAO reductase YedYZ molybdopterin-dependent catalytic subunit